MPDQRGSWFRVYSRQIIVHPKFRSLSYPELGAWLALRSEADLLGGVPFPDRRAALQALARKRGPSARMLDRLIDLRLLDVGSDGSIAIHDLGDHGRPEYPSDSKAARRERQQRSRQVSRVVTNGVTTPREEEIREEEIRADKTTPPLPSKDDPLTVICELLQSAAPIEDRKYRTKVDDQARRYGNEWVIASYRQAFKDFIEVGDRPSRWDLLHHAEKHLAGWTRAEELRREEVNRVRDEEPKRELTPEEAERQELMRRAIGIWVRGGRKGQVPTEVDDLQAWIAANEQGEAA